jgi:rhodanese-related sulfurtransferase
MSMSMIVIVIIVIVVVIAVWYSMNQTGNQTATHGASAHQVITPQEYQANYAQRDHFLVDVRTAEEFQGGHLPGATNIALQELPQRMDSLPKDQTIVLYCRSGARSHTAAEMLAKEGFADVHDLGGIVRWQAQGLPVE